jgi:sporulation protein YunB
MGPLRFRHRFRARSGRTAVLRLWLGPGVLLLLLFGMMQWMEWRIRPVVAATARAVAVNAATTAVTHAVTAEVVADADGQSLIHVEREADGVQLARVDLGVLTRLESAANARAENALREMSKQTLRIPAGQLTGSILLSGAGPAVPVHLRLMGAVHSSLAADVQSAGVNQTVHAFYFDVSAQVNVVAPLVSEPVQLHTRVPVAYLVFIGDVPRVWWGPSGSGNASKPVDPGMDFQ